MTKALWERLPDEPAEWYARFTTYRLMGNRRSLLGLYNQERASRGQANVDHAPTNWKNAYLKYEWEKRVLAWTEQEARLQQKKFIEQRNVARERRQAIISALEVMLANVMNKQQENPDYITPQALMSIATAAKVIMDQSRMEWGEMTPTGEPTGIADTASAIRVEGIDYRNAVRALAPNNDEPQQPDTGIEITTTASRPVEDSITPSEG